MVRYTLFVVIVMAAAASAVAAVAPARSLRLPANNVTVAFKNQDFPVLGPVMVTPCATEDCSDSAS